MKNRWYKNFTQKGDVKHNSNFQNIFENQGILFSKMDKKGIARKRQTFQNEGFFFVQKSGKDEKTGDAKVDKTKTPKTIATTRKDKRNKKTCAYTKKTQQRDQSQNWWEKDMKKRR